MKPIIKPNNSILMSVTFLIFMDSIGLGLVLPILPTLFLNKDFGLAINISFYSINFIYGLAIALFPLGALFGMPILGRMSDKIGRKNALLFGVSGLIFGHIISIISLLTHNYWLFFIARFITGFGSGTYAICNAAVMDLSADDESKISNLKYITLANVSGFILGPALALFIQAPKNSFILAFPFIISLVLCLLNGVFITILYPKPIQIVSNKHKIKIYHAFKFKELDKSIRFMFNLELGYLLVSYLLFNFGFQIYLQSQSIYLAEIYHYTVNQLGLFFVFMGLSLTFSMFFLQPMINRFCSTQSQIKVGSLVIGIILISHMLIKMVFNAYFGSLIELTFIVSLIFYIITPFVLLNITKIFSDFVSLDVQGNLMGSLGQLSSLATFLSALIMGVLLHLGANFTAGSGGILILISYILMKFKTVQLSK